MEQELLDFLGSVKELQFELARARDRVARIEDQCYKCTTSWSPTPGGGSGDPHKDAMFVNLADERDRARELERELRARETEVDEFLSKIKSRLHRYILKLKYVDLMSERQIENLLSSIGYPCSGRTVRNHRSAMEAEVQSLWEKERGKHGG